MNRTSQLYERRQSRFERRESAIEFVTVKRQPGFEPQRVARAEPARLAPTPAPASRIASNRRRRPFPSEQLEAVLAGVTGARRDASDSRD